MSEIILFGCTVGRSECGRYIVRFFDIEGRHHPPSDYYTDDHEDARGTAAITLRRSQDQHRGGLR